MRRGKSTRTELVTGVEATYRHHIDPSELDRLVDLVPDGTPVREASGSWIKTDGTTIQVRAKVVYGVPSEGMEGDRLNLSQILTITVRNQGLDALDGNWKVVYSGDTYNIEGSREVGRDTFLELYCDILKD